MNVWSSWATTRPPRSPTTVLSRLFTASPTLVANSTRVALQAGQAEISVCVGRHGEMLCRPHAGHIPKLANIRTSGGLQAGWALTNMCWAGMQFRVCVLPAGHIADIARGKPAGSTGMDICVW